MSDKPSQMTKTASYVVELHPTACFSQLYNRFWYESYFVMRIIYKLRYIQGLEKGTALCANSGARSTKQQTPAICFKDVYIVGICMHRPSFTKTDFLSLRGALELIAMDILVLFRDRKKKILS